MPRLQETMWVLEHLDDLEADFLVFYRIEDIYSMESERFFRFASRAGAYGGVMTARIQHEQEKSSRKHAGRRGSTAGSAPQQVPVSALGEFVERG